MMKLENSYDEFCEEQVQKRIESEYTGDRFEIAIRDQLKAIKREQPEWFVRVVESTRREVAVGRLKSAIRTSLNLPSFEQWSKQNQQQRLF